MSLTKQVFTLQVTANTTMAPNVNYMVNQTGSLVVLTLPAVSNVGDVIQVTGASTNGWKIQSNAAAASQTVLGYGVTDLTEYTPPSSSSSAVDLVFSSLYTDVIALECIVANSTWVVMYSTEAIGSLTASGGTVTTLGPYNIHTFTSSGTFTINSGAGPVQYLIVAGGGGGAGGVGSGGNASTGGGGGAGGNLPGSIILPAGAYTVTIGGGGSGGAGSGSGIASNGTNGANSVFGTLTAIGGGHGSAFSGGAGGNGGSGGGSYGGSGGGTGTAGQGNAGSPTGPTFSAGGGGGAGAAASAQNAGNGLSNDISGSAVTYAGGGGGGGFSGGGGAGSGGTGGGGSGGNGGGAGTANTGGGGGGGNGNNGGASSGGAGGSGIVIIRYRFR